MSKANGASLNVEGVFQHILNDLFAFIATLVAGLVMVFTGFTRADAIASLIVVVLMAVAGVRLVRDSGRILLEAAPTGVDVDTVGADLAAVPAPPSKDQPATRRKTEAAGQAPHRRSSVDFSS